MDPRSGEIYEVVDEADAKAKGLIPIKRDLRPLEIFQKQIALYSPCGCGSGEKFKFCCYQRQP